MTSTAHAQRKHSSGSGQRQRPEWRGARILVELELRFARLVSEQLAGHRSNRLAGHLGVWSPMPPL
eukprot:8940855-Alexandrium_andersonii.AAC.1